MSKIGYLRVSTEEQLLDRQIAGLRPICDELHLEKVSAATKRRPVYNRVVRKLRRGDTLVVWDTDRAYRSALDALNELAKLEARGIGFFAVNFPLDTTTDWGHCALTVKFAFDEMERKELIRRTKEGLASARLRGKVLGRPRKLKPDQVAEARRRLAAETITIAELAPEYDVSLSTMIRALADASEQT